MKHYCSACSREFSDDSGAFPDSGRVYCVFCGARIRLTSRPSAREVDPAEVPFSDDQRRLETFALGIIAGHTRNFPDTLRQFRVPAPKAQRRQDQAAKPSRRSDTLRPVAHEQDSSPPQRLSRSPWRHGPLALWLAVGFGVGVVMARHLANSEPASEPTRQLPAARATPAQPPQPERAPAAATAVAAAAAAPAPTPPSATAVATGAAASAAAPQLVKASVFNRRWLLQQARSHQRSYHLAEAERLYRRVLSRAPRDSEALAGLGELELLRGTLSKADEHFQQALRANADYIPALIAVADIRWQQGRADDAREAYRNIVEHYADDAYPPYVAKRSAQAAFPDCEATTAGSDSSGDEPSASSP